jgi:hypothetical protein
VASRTIEDIPQNNITDLEPLLAGLVTGPAALVDDFSDVGVRELDRAADNGTFGGRIIGGALSECAGVG